MLLDEVEWLDAEVSRLEVVEQKCHVADKQVCVLQGQRRRNIALVS